MKQLEEQTKEKIIVKLIKKKESKAKYNLDDIGGED